MCKAIELTNNLFNASENIRAEWKELHNKLSIADQKKNDVEHFIEMNNYMNACQGYKLYKLLKEVLAERREIKNQIMELKPLLDFVNTTRVLTDDKKKIILKQSITDKHRFNNNQTTNIIYNVRVLTGLFGNEIQKEVI